MHRSPALAVAFAAVILLTSAQTGVYTDSVCSCSLFPADPSGECIRLVSPGQCIIDGAGCKAGYRCDLVGTVLCTRTKCKSLSRTPTAVIPTSSTSTIECTEKDNVCVSHTGNEDPLLPTPTPSSFCLWSDTECTCSMSPASSGSCVRLSSPASGSDSAKCHLGDCTAGYKCDCQGTETCTRSDCQKWKSSGAQGAGDFDCAQTPIGEENCVAKKAEVERHTQTDI